MGIESTSEVWESTKPFVGRSAAFMRPRRRRGSSEKARSRWQFRCIAAPRNQFVIDKAGILDSGLFLCGRPAKSFIGSLRRPIIRFLRPSVMAAVC